MSLQLKLGGSVIPETGWEGLDSDYWHTQIVALGTAMNVSFATEEDTTDDLLFLYYNVTDDTLIAADGTEISFAASVSAGCGITVASDVVSVNRSALIEVNGGLEAGAGTCDIGVKVDGSTIQINGSGELVATSGGLTGGDGITIGGGTVEVDDDGVTVGFTAGGQLEGKYTAGCGLSLTGAAFSVNNTDLVDGSAGLQTAGSCGIAAKVDGSTVIIDGNGAIASTVSGDPVLVLYGTANVASTDATFTLTNLQLPNGADPGVSSVTVTNDPAINTDGSSAGVWAIFNRLVGTSNIDRWSTGHAGNIQLILQGFTGWDGDSEQVLSHNETGVVAWMDTQFITLQVA